jgi:hypothetical protein
MNFMSDYSNELVDLISDFLQNYMKVNNTSSLTADECADILAENRILRNDIGPKPGFNFRQVLRDGREGKIKLVKGAYQSRPHTRWIIKRLI